jgi:hypothetical protein
MIELYKSLAAFQQEVPTIHKGTEGYGYSYANLTEILIIINPLLKKHNLGFTQLLEGQSLKTIIFSTEFDQRLESVVELPFESLNYSLVTKKSKDGKEYEVSQILGFEGMNKAQAIGSLISYFRRYALSAALGLVTDKDTDAAGEQTKIAATDDNRAWLNLTNKDGSFKPEYLALQKAIADGKTYTLESMKAKYKISKENLTLLNNLGIK